MKSIFKSVALITGFTFLTRALGFFFRVYLSRAIGAEALGMYQVALSVFLVLLTLVSSGFTLIISRTTASLRVSKNRRQIGSLISSSLLVGLAVSIILCLIVFLFRNIFSNLFTDKNCMLILIILMPSLVFSSVYSVFRGAMWGNNNFFGLCVTELFEQIVKIVVCVLLLASGMSVLQNALSVAWAFTISCIASAVFVTLLYFYYGGNLDRPSKIYRQVVRQSAPITAVRVTSSFVQPLIALILPAMLISSGFTSNQAMSMYGVAVGMALPFLYIPSSIIGSLATALVPDISTALAQNDKEHIQKRVQSSVVFAVFVSFLIEPVFIAIGDKFGLFIYNNALSGMLLQFSAWIMVPIGITNITSAILNSIGLEVKSFVNYVIGAIFMFLAIWLLPKYIGINSLFVGLGISSIFSSILNLRMIKKHLNIKVDITKNLFLMFLFSIPTIAITAFSSSLLSYILPTFFDLVLSTILGITIFVLLCEIFKVINFSMYFISFKEKLSGGGKISKLSFWRKKKTMKNKIK